MKQRLRICECKNIKLILKYAMEAIVQSLQQSLACQQLWELTTEGASLSINDPLEAVSKYFSQIFNKAWEKKLALEKPIVHRCNTQTVTKKHGIAWMIFSSLFYPRVLFP